MRARGRTEVGTAGGVSEEQVASPIIPTFVRTRSVKRQSGVPANFISAIQVDLAVSLN